MLARRDRNELEGIFYRAGGITGFRAETVANCSFCTISDIQRLAKLGMLIYSVEVGFQGRFGMHGWRCWLTDAGRIELTGAATSGPMPIASTAPAEDERMKGRG